MPTILETLGALPDGSVRELKPEAFARYLQAWHPVASKSESQRRQDMRQRLDLYKDRGRPHLEATLDRLFKNTKVRELRKEMLELAEFQNLIKRIIREISTVYSEPAARTVGKGNKAFQKLVADVSYDRQMRKVNRLGNLCNNVLVWPDIDPLGKPTLRVITPDKFVAIPHPNDPLLPVAYIVDQCRSGAAPTAPHYMGMSDTEYFWLDKDWRLVRTADYPTGMYQHGYDALPALLWSYEEPDETLLDSTSGRDMVSAQLAVALINVMMIKHQKSGAKIPYASGDTSNLARGQAMDEENIIELGEGVTLNTLDLGADPNSYINACRAVIKQIAANRGIPESVFDLSYSASSGFEIELKRVGLREIRREQILNFRPFEKKLAELWSKVLVGTEWAFDLTKWSIDFGDLETPQDPQAKLAYWEKLEEMGLVNAVQMYMELNPEATPEEAAQAIDDNLKMRRDKIRIFQESSVSPMNPKDPGGQINSDRGAVEKVESETAPAVGPQDE